MSTAAGRATRPQPLSRLDTGDEPQRVLLRLLVGEPTDERRRHEVRQVQPQQVGRVLAGHQHPGVVLPAVPARTLDEPATGCEGRQGPGLVDEYPLPGMPVAHVHRSLGQPGSQVEDAHAEPLVEVLTSLGLVVGEGQPPQ